MAPSNYSDYLVIYRFAFIFPLALNSEYLHRKNNYQEYLYFFFLFYKQYTFQTTYQAKMYLKLELYKSLKSTFQHTETYMEHFFSNSNVIFLDLDNFFGSSQLCPYSCTCIATKSVCMPRNAFLSSQKGQKKCGCFNDLTKKNFVYILINSKASLKGSGKPQVKNIFVNLFLMP